MTVIETIAQAELGVYSRGDCLMIEETGLLYLYSSSSTATRNGLTILNTGDSTGRLLASGSQQLSVPVGTILPFASGYFGASANGGGWTSIPTNTVAGVNSWLSSNGFSNFKVCDGTAPNDSGSPIFNTSSRYLPDLTDSRFLQGFTAAGAVAASSATFSGTPATITGGNHSHTLSDAGYACLFANAPDDRLYARSVTSVSWNATKYNVVTDIAADVANTDTRTIGVALGGSTDATSSHSHSYTPAGTISSVVPKYFNCFYIMRIK